MAKTNRERVGEALDLFVTGYRPFVLQQMESRYPGQGQTKATEYLGQRARSGVHVPLEAAEWDTGCIITVILSEWQYLFRLKLGKAERGMLGELEEIRNNWAHQQAFSTDDTLRALDTIKRLLGAIGAGAQVGEVDKVHGEVMRARFAEMQRTATDRARRQPTEGTPEEGLRPWRDIITPHPDVCSGTFAQAEFAADLAQVHRGGALPEYGDAKEFFRRTYLTEGLSGLLLNAIKRLSGKGGHPVIELQTNFGGGKTHSLLALYHTVSGVPAANLAGMDVLVTQAGVSTLPKAERAVLVGTALSAGQPEKTEDGLTLHTLWGRLADQIGGKKAYKQIESSDVHGTAPGSDDLVKLFRSVGPVLLLVDEWVAYCRQMYETPGLAGGSFDANMSFAQALTEAVRAVPNALLVASLPQSDVEVGGEGGKQALARLQHTFGRLEFNWRPANAEESYEIVRRRLFEPVAEPKLFADRDAVIQHFAAIYRQNGAEFPGECKEGDYLRRMESAYPIHPELFDRLYNDWSSLEDFQRTRGVLRLMAQVIHTLWTRNDRSLLILPGLVPMDEPGVESELTRYLTPNWPVIIEKDVDGPNSLPKRLDAESPRFGRLWATRRVARAVYLGSAPVEGQANKGLDIRRIRLGCVQPGENIAVFGDALRQLGDHAAHLYNDGSRYWYSTQPNVGHVARDRAAQKTEDELFEEIRRRLAEEQRHRGSFAKVHAAPNSSGDVPDETDARLVILPPEKPHASGQGDSPAMLAAMQILEQRGNSPRINRNALVFLAPDKTRLNDLQQACAAFLAWKSIHDEKESLGLDPFNASLAERKMEDSSRTVLARIPETFQWLLVPEQTSPTGKAEWQAIRLSGQEGLAVRAAKRLEREGLLCTTMAGAILRLHLDRVLWAEADHVSVRKLEDYFAQYPYLPRLASAGLVVEAVRDGIASTVWATETFAYASGYDEARARYVGLVAGRAGAVVSNDPQSLVVKAAVALKQIEADQQKVSSGGTTAAGESEDRGDGEKKTDEPQPPKPPVHAKPKRFYGSVKLNPQRVGRDAGKIAEEIIQHLTLQPGATVEVTLEIQAQIPEGASDSTVRTVMENARTLKFLTQSFEKE